MDRRGGDFARPTQYADHYLAEFAYRFNRRLNLAGMVSHLLRAAVTTNLQPLSMLSMLSQDANQKSF
jgi:hypothetical protein